MNEEPKRMWYIVLFAGISFIKDEWGYDEPTEKDIEYAEDHYREYYGTPCTVTNVFSVPVE